MRRFPDWAKWPIIAAGVLLSPVFAFLLALSVGVLVAVIKEAGFAASLAALGIGAITYFGLRRLRGPPRDQLGDT
jgi:hypothetical protein